jgi:hypothetical protein
MLGLGKLLEEEEASSPDLFPELRDDQDRVVACDYSGEHHNPLKVLLCSLWQSCRASRNGNWKGWRFAKDSFNTVAGWLSGTYPMRGDKEPSNLFFKQQNA